MLIQKNKCWQKTTTQKHIAHGEKKNESYVKDYTRSFEVLSQHTLPCVTSDPTDMATELRPTTRFQPPDWFTSNYTISTNAERQRSASHQTRQEGRFLRNETDSQTKWDQYSNNVRLADRVDNIRKVSWIFFKFQAKPFPDHEKMMGLSVLKTFQFLFCSCLPV